MTSTAYRRTIPTRLFALPLCIAALALTGCDGNDEEERTTPSDVTDQAGETVDTTGDLVEQEVNEFRENMQREIAQLNREIELLDERADSIDENTREGYDNAMRDLRERRDAIEMRLVELEVNTQAAWVEVRAGLERSWQELSEALADARDQFGDDDL